jgi:hypothetical protein
MRRRARCTMRAGVCQSAQPIVSDSASARVSVRQSRWNQRTRASARQTTVNHKQLLAPKSVKLKCWEPKSLSRWMLSSARHGPACAHRARRAPRRRRCSGPSNGTSSREQAVLGARVQGLAAHDQRVRDGQADRFRVR